MCITVVVESRRAIDARVVSLGNGDPSLFEQSQVVNLLTHTLQLEGSRHLPNFFISRFLLRERITQTRERVSFAMLGRRERIT